MVHHIVLYKLKQEVTPQKLEEMMMNTRINLLKIAEAQSVKCGKKIDPKCEWPFFIALDFESTDKLAMCYEHPMYLKFLEDVIKPNTLEKLVLDYEMEPGKDVKYS